jgi:hypothetical protein
METVTLQDMVMAVADAMKDLVTGTTSAASADTTHFVDTGKANGRDRWWENSEVFFLEPAATAAGLTATQPFEVRGYVSASGLFTLNKPFKAAGNVPVSLDYALIRNQGRGTPFRGYVNAIKYALRKLDISSDSTDASIVTQPNVYEYVVPAGLSTVYDVYLDKTGYGHLGIRPDWWDVAPGRTLVLKNRNLTVSLGWTLQLKGRIWATPPTSLTGTMSVPLEEMVDLAQEYLLRNSTRSQENTRSQGLQEERLRFSNNYVYPNEKELG